MKPMLASPTDGTELRYPLLASPKLDGIRCLIIDGVAMSRNLKPLPNAHVQKLFGRKEFNGLDGELICGLPSDSNVFQKTTSAVMAHEGRPMVTFFVFDTFLGDLDFVDRLQWVKKKIYGFPNLEFVTHKLIRHRDELEAYEETCLDERYEGVMLRAIEGPYKHGRSTLKEGWLLKLKRFEDSEARVIAVHPLLTNTNLAVRNALGHLERSSKQAGKRVVEMLGALTVEDVRTKVRFELGTGFTETQRVELWLDRHNLGGKLVKYKYQPTGIKDKPRFPVFLGWRHPSDV